MLFHHAVPTDPRYFPMLLTEEGGEGSALSLVEIWNRSKTLPRGVKDILVSDEISERLKSLQDKFHIEINAVGAISILVRKLFFGEVRLADLGGAIGDILSDTGGGDPKQAAAISEFIQKEILTIKPKPRTEEVDEEERNPTALVRLPLLQALSQYENLGNQLITQERIRIKSQSEPVRPSLLYWIKYYRDELGIGHHNSVERGNFLFRSENGQHLSAEERERVNLVLKSVEENYPLDIDTERSEIVFPPFESQRVAPPRPIPAAPTFAPATPAFPSIAPTAPTTLQPSRSNPTFHFGGGGVMGTSGIPKHASAGTLSFTSKHVFPAEKSAASPTPSTPSVPTPAAPRTVPIVSPKGNPFHIRPVSLGERDKDKES